MGSLGKDILLKSSSQVIVSLYEASEFPNPTLESPDQLINVERGPTTGITPEVFVTTRITTPSNIGTRITMNKSTSKDLIEPFITTNPSSRRCLQTYCVRLVQEIAHAKPQEFLETHKVRTGVP
jgi:hypothetical protein